MNTYLPVIVIALSFVACTRQIAEKPANSVTAPSGDVNTFLNLSYPMFEGSFNGSAFAKTDGANNYFCNTGWFNGDTDGICYPDDPHRCVVAGLTALGGGDGSFALYSPRYNSASDSDWSQIFSLGTKILGSRVTNFYLSMNLGNDTYETRCANGTNEINILKVEPFSDAAGSKMRVWFTLHATLVSVATGQTASLSNGMMIGEFYGYKNN